MSPQATGNGSRHDQNDRHHWDVPDSYAEQTPSTRSATDVASTEAVIGLAAAGSVLLVLITIFVGYWLVTRRMRRALQHADVYDEGKWSQHALYALFG